MPRRRYTPEGFLRVSEVAAIFHVSRTTVTCWSLARRLPFHRTLGGQRIYNEKEIRELAASLVGPPREVPR